MEITRYKANSDAKNKKERDKKKRKNKQLYQSLEGVIKARRELAPPRAPFIIISHAPGLDIVPVSNSPLPPFFSAHV